MCTVFFFEYSVCSRNVVTLIIVLYTSNDVLLRDVASLYVCVHVIEVFYSVLQRSSGLGAEMQQSDYIQWGIEQD